MRHFICLILIAWTAFFVVGCAVQNTASTPAISQEQAVAGAEYLDASATRMLDLLKQAKADDPAVAAKADNAAQVVEKVVTATEAFKDNSTQKKWDFAKAALDAAVQVAMPIVVNAVLK